MAALRKEWGRQAHSCHPAKSGDPVGFHGSGLVFLPPHDIVLETPKLVIHRLNSSQILGSLSLFSFFPFLPPAQKSKTM